MRPDSSPSTTQKRQHHHHPLLNISPSNSNNNTLKDLSLVNKKSKPSTNQSSFNSIINNTKNNSSSSSNQPQNNYRRSMVNNKRSTQTRSDREEPNNCKPSPKPTPDQSDQARETQSSSGHKLDDTNKIPTSSPTEHNQPNPSHPSSYKSNLEQGNSIKSSNSNQSNLNWSWWSWGSLRSGSSNIRDSDNDSQQPVIIGPGTVESSSSPPLSGTISLVEPPSSITTNSINDEQPQNDSQQQNQQDPNRYQSGLGNWIYSWYRTDEPASGQRAQPEAGPEPEMERAGDGAQKPDRVNSILESIPNPIVESISESSGGWANYFSSRKPLPGTKKLEESDKKSVESMEIEGVSPTSGELDRAEVTEPPKELRGRTSFIGFNLGKKRMIEAENSPSKASSVASGSNFGPSLTGPQKPTVLPPMTESTLPLSQSNKKLRVRSIPNMLLPSFEDTFMSPPRSFYPHHPSSSSKLKQTLDLVQTYIFPVPPGFPQTVAGEEDDGHQSNKRRKRKVIEIFERNRHKCTRLPRSYDLLGINRVERLKRVKELVVIGIHGWFPGPVLESVIGKPTGTSHKFTTMMYQGLRRYLEGQIGTKLDGDSVTIIPLEGEGKVDQRTDLFYQRLCARQDWLEKLRLADGIFFVSHSQGTLVSCKLIERLIKGNKLRGDRVLSLCMCGIWNGPYTGLNKNYALQPMLKLFEGPAAHELFEFQDHQSLASKALLSSLNTCLSSGVKLLLVGSLNDQVVPLHSALNTGVDHPSIIRTVFIDSEVFKTADFLTNLVVFCQRLRNSGLSDHGLQSFLSEGFIGSLNGVGHSTVYEENQVFDFAVRYFFEVSSTLEYPTLFHTNSRPSNLLVKPPRTQSNSYSRNLHSEASSSLNNNGITMMNNNESLKKNPFMITWILRGLIEDQKIKLLFGNQLDLIRSQFDDWIIINNNSVNNKILKDLKVKLEPLKIDFTE